MVALCFPFNVVEDDGVLFGVAVDDSFPFYRRGGRQLCVSLLTPWRKMEFPFNVVVDDSFPFNVV